MMKILDAHCHLGFAKNPKNLARTAKTLGINAWCNTVTPEEFLSLEPLLSDEENALVGLGIHPWWVKDLTGVSCSRASDGDDGGDGVCNATSQLDLFMQLLPKVRLVGEVGLDYAPRHLETKQLQLAVFRSLLDACSQAGDKIISVHCVRAYDDALSVIEETGVTNTCELVFHWFSGNGDDLRRAIELGCSFSVGPRMIATKRGRAYVRQVPAERLLVETDAPYVDALAADFEPIDFDVVEWRASLDRVLDEIVSIQEERYDYFEERWRSRWQDSAYRIDKL